MPTVAMIATDTMPKPWPAAGTCPHAAPPCGVRWLLHYPAVLPHHILPIRAGNHYCWVREVGYGSMLWGRGRIW